MFALEQLQAITNKQSETPHEAWFQKTYSPLIENAFHALKNPEEPSKPQSSWAKFRQVGNCFPWYQFVVTVYIKKLETSLHLHERDLALGRDVNDDLKMAS